MNENIDIAFMGAKMASSKNEVAHMTVLGLSMAYNFGQLARYRYLSATCQNAMVYGVNYQTNMGQVERYNSEIVKHAILGILDVATCIAVGVNGLRK